MTNQAFPMAVAIQELFPEARHRLCYGYIIEHSKKKIRALRSKEGLTKDFNKVLMHCDVEAEFEHF